MYIGSISGRCLSREAKLASPYSDISQMCTRGEIGTRSPSSRLIADNIRCRPFKIIAIVPFEICFLQSALLIL